jgi:hypothetical protein
MTTQSPSSTSATARLGLLTRPLWLVGVVAGVVAAVAVTLVVIGALALGVPMQAASQATAAAEDIPVSAFAVLTLAFTAAGTVLAIALARWAKRPAPVFVVVTVILTILSLAAPIATANATTATRLVLALTHVVAAAVVIPALALRLAARPARP